jgi:hypothetical protein
LVESEELTMATLDLMVPVVPEEPPPADLTMAPRRGFPDGARLTLIDNGKPRARELMLLIADGLRQRLPIADVAVFNKGSASRVIDEAEIAHIADTSDAVIAGLGDCGACSACSLGDALKMEGAGVPATVLISDVFIGHIASFSVTMGMPGYHNAVVPHPVSSKDDEQLAAYAASVVDVIATQLAGDTLGAAPADAAELATTRR